MSLKKLQQETGIAKSTLSLWLRAYPLDSKTITARQRANAKQLNKSKPLNWYKKLPKSPYNDLIQKDSDTRNSMKISEAAILFRLAVYGFEVYSSFFDGTKVDFVVESRNNPALLKIQVRTTKRPPSTGYGVPQVSLMCQAGRKKLRRYTDSEMDCLIGYDQPTDTAYIWVASELKNHRRQISITEEASERWDKILTPACQSSRAIGGKESHLFYKQKSQERYLHCPSNTYSQSRRQIDTSIS